MDKKWTVTYRYFTGGLIAGCVALFIYTPQMLVWTAMFRVPIINPYHPHGLDLLHPRMLQYLFSPGYGLFTWTPVIFFSILGFIPLFKKDKKMTVCLFITFLLKWYLFSCIASWPGAYGARHFVSSSPLLILGIAALSEVVIKRVRGGLWLTLSVSAILTLWNFLSIIQYTLKFLPRDGSTSWDLLIFGKFRMISELVKRMAGLIFR